MVQKREVHISRMAGTKRVATGRAGNFDLSLPGDRASSRSPALRVPQTAEDAIVIAPAEPLDSTHAEKNHKRWYLALASRTLSERWEQNNLSAQLFSSLVTRRCRKERAQPTGVFELSRYLIRLRDVVVGQRITSSNRANN